MRRAFPGPNRVCYLKPPSPLQGRSREPLDHEQSLPPFQIVATGTGFRTEQDIDRAIADYGPLLSQSTLGSGHGDVEVRRSGVVGIGKRPRTRWLYRRIWEAVQEFNARSFCVDISDIEENIQLACYDSAEGTASTTGIRTSPSLRHDGKISLSVQLSRSEDYEGGDLELLFRGQPYRVERAKGTFIAFPSFALHRVTPVTRGTRWSLVAWISGARWR